MYYREKRILSIGRVWNEDEFDVEIQGETKGIFKIRLRNDYWVWKRECKIIWLDTFCKTQMDAIMFLFSKLKKESNGKED